MKNLNIDKLITVDETGMPCAPSISQLLDKDVRELYERDNFPDKRMYIAECGIVYYMGDPKSPARQQGLSDKECLQMAIEQFNLPYGYQPDELVKRLIDKYYKQNITEAGIAIEALHRSLHLISIAATKINELLANKLDAPELVTDDIPMLLRYMDNVNEKVTQIPELVKSLGIAYENLRNEEETAIARGGKQILSSMNADDEI